MSGLGPVPPDGGRRTARAIGSPMSKKPPQKTSIAPRGYDSVTAPTVGWVGGLESAFGV